MASGRVGASGPFPAPKLLLAYVNDGTRILKAFTRKKPDFLAAHSLDVAKRQTGAEGGGPGSVVSDQRTEQPTNGAINCLDARVRRRLLQRKRLGVASAVPVA